MIILSIIFLRWLYKVAGKKALLRGLTVIGFALVTALFVAIHCDRIVRQHADGRCYTELNEIPSTEWGILLGTGRSHRANEYYDARLSAAIALYRAHKIGGIYISAENLYEDYHEADSMYAALINAGIPAARILCDTQGVDTYRSLCHAKSQVGPATYTVISQHFHNERALYYADVLKMDVVAFDAAPNSKWYKRLRDFLREKPARVKAVL